MSKTTKYIVKYYTTYDVPNVKENNRALVTSEPLNYHAATTLIERINRFSSLEFVSMTEVQDG